MNIKNFQDLQDKKKQLKSEISEIESILKFKNPRKSFGAMTDGISEKYFGSILNSKLIENFLPVAGNLLGNSVKLGSLKILSSIAKKTVKSSFIKKGLIGIGTIAIASILLKRAKRKVDQYQQRETIKSINNLI